MAVKKKAVTKKSTVNKKTVAKSKAAPKKAAVTKKAASPKKAAVKKATASTATKKKSPPAGSKSKATQPVAKKKTSPRKASTASVPSSSATSISLHGIPPYVEKRGETYMNNDQVAHFRSILNNWKIELMEEVDRTVHHMQDEAANFPDPNDRASQESEFALELRTRDRERKLIKKIDESLDGLDNDEYGYCDVCGIEIGIRRLEARPTATQCIDCKTLDEIREKQTRV